MANDQETLGISNHTPIEHKSGECPSEETGSSCMFCDGGLFGCSVCSSFEGATTTDCPGEKMTAEQNDEVYAGNLDFKDGKWIAECSPHTPAYYRKYYVG